MQQKANSTFLWVALVMRELQDVQAYDILQVLDEVPTELTSVYWRMMEHMKTLKRRDKERCRRVLSTVVATYRPLHLQELYVLADLPNQGCDVEQSTAMIVKMCGSFLTLREDHVYVIHQSAGDFLSNDADSSMFPLGKCEVHRHVFSRSIEVLSRTIQRDIYNLHALGYPIEQVQQPKPDPLAASRYSSIYWIDHLCDWNSDSSSCGTEVLRSGGIVDSFMRKKYLYWLETLSLFKSMSKGIVSMARLEALTEERASTSSTMEVVRDACRFSMYHKSAIESSPLQAYGALLFTPTDSVIRALFKDEEPQEIMIKPVMQKQWSSCLQTLEGHSSYVSSVTFSHDSTLLASASRDDTVKVWDARSGECLSTLKGHSSWVSSVAFSHDSTLLASASADCTVKLWDARSGECLSTFKGHSSWVNSVAFSHDSTLLAYISSGCTVKVWDARSGECLSTLKGHNYSVISVALSYDLTRLASASWDHTVKVWDTCSGECLSTLKGHGQPVGSVAFSYDLTRLASASADGTVKVWDAHSGECLSTLRCHSLWVHSVAFSYDSARLASASNDRTVKILDARSGECLQTLEGHSDSVRSVAFSYDSTLLASASYDHTVKVWDARCGKCLSTFKGHSSPVMLVAFSHNSILLASMSSSRTVKVWNTRSGECLSTLEGHSSSVSSVALSHDSIRLASASRNGKVKVLDARSGECLSTLEGHSDSVNSVAFSHNSTRLATASNDRTVKVWNAHSGEFLQTLNVERALYNISFDSMQKPYPLSINAWL
ncbi:WD40 repeat-like protein [Lentithecium fluviatile CBS 122367]|uniref:WD40 repeat-like protein n=1 Tax=Lentithecium fluviatile CBS 122367 TaxID=1168545 RepID=A0A6G1IUV2_9PLEO|nr:WD40 repeat-like protein [Lentithecium fluviatile CBS 122367]